MPAKRIVYALNAESGQGWANDATGFGNEVELSTGTTFEELRAATDKALERPAAALIVQGGDGMASMGAEFASALDLPLGVVPTGTGNDFARSVGIPRGRPNRVRSRLIDAIQGGTARFRTVDLMRFTVDGEEHVAVNSVNIGFDALVNERANQKRHLRGTSRYLVALTQSVRNFRSQPFRYAVDDCAPQRISAELITILNGRTVGGGIPLIPQARPDDGELDVIIVSGLGRLGLTLLFPLALVGLHTFLSPVRTARSRSIRVEVPAGVPIYADGECIRRSSATIGSTVEITVDPGALRLVRS